MNKKSKEALLSYVRATLAAAIALYLAGYTDPQELLNALIAGIVNHQFAGYCT